MTPSFSAPEDLQALVARARALLPPVCVDLVGVVPLFQELTQTWHYDALLPMDPSASVVACARQLHLYNFRLWHTEDKVRRPDASDRLIATCKRSIDADNQQRHHEIERLDELLFAYLYEQHNRRRQPSDLHSETPASLVDRLSISTLKIYHMAREAERQDATPAHRQRCRQRLRVLEEQGDDLWACLCHLSMDLWEGRKYFKMYRQFKMYNDPELNPEIYRHPRGQASSETSR